MDISELIYVRGKRREKKKKKRKDIQKAAAVQGLISPPSSVLMIGYHKEARQGDNANGFKWREENISMHELLAKSHDSKLGTKYSAIFQTKRTEEE
jgi:hypothetical protein